MHALNPYIGRYAPSPSGDLHMGNLRTALLAWLHARVHNGQFLLRIEDIDMPRTVSGSADKIVTDLQWLGLDWDGDVVYQSNRLDLYQQALDELVGQGLVYPCFCSRKDIQQAASAPHRPTGIYPGTCADLTTKQIEKRVAIKPPALRLRVANGLVDSCGDFVIKRADGLFSYQLAVAVDDMAQGVTHVVRGQDLADSTQRQLHIASLLHEHSAPISYWHVPLLCDAQGRRLAKRDGSHGISHWRADGNSPEQLVGLFAYQLKLSRQPLPISAQDLLLKAATSADYLSQAMDIFDKYKSV